MFVPPPAAKGTIMRIGQVGQFCASADVAMNSTPVASSATAPVRMDAVLIMYLLGMCSGLLLDVSALEPQRGAGTRQRLCLPSLPSSGRATPCRGVRLRASRSSCTGEQIPGDAETRRVARDRIGPMSGGGRAARQCCPAATSAREPTCANVTKKQTPPQRGLCEGWCLLHDLLFPAPSDPAHDAEPCRHHGVDFRFRNRCGHLQRSTVRAAVGSRNQSADSEIVIAGGQR